MFRSPIFIILLMLVAFATIFSFAPAQAKERQLLTLASVDEEGSRISHTVLTEAYGKLAINLIVHYFPSERALEESNEGRTDGEINRISGMQRQYPNLIRVDTPINEAWVSACSKTPDLQISGWESLRNYRIGSRFGIKLMEKETAGWTNKHSAHTQEKLFELLVHDRLDIVIGGEQELLKQMSQYPSGLLHIASPPIQIAPLYHYLHKKHAALIPRITAVLSAMEKSGRIRAIRAEAILKLKQRAQE